MQLTCHIISLCNHLRLNISFLRKIRQQLGTLIQREIKKGNIEVK